jgi:hypothetical protein
MKLLGGLGEIFKTKFTNTDTPKQPPPQDSPQIPSPPHSSLSPSLPWSTLPPSLHPGIILTLQSITQGPSPDFLHPDYPSTMDSEWKELFDLHRWTDTAIEMMRIDPALPKIRRSAVPATMEDEEFWCRYFYKVKVSTDNFVKQQGGGKKELENKVGEKESERVKDCGFDDVDVEVEVDVQDDVPGENEDV